MNSYLLIKILLIVLFFTWSCISYYIFYSNAKPVYSYKKDIEISTAQIEFDGSLNARDLFFCKIYDAQNNTLYKENIIVKGYQWSNWTSIHRLLFLDKNGIKNAQDSDKIYFYLYLNNYVLFFNNQVFGLTPNTLPSKINLYGDYFRYSTKIAFLIFIILWFIIEWVEKKYVIDKKWNFDAIIKIIPTPIIIFFIILILLF